MLEESLAELDSWVATSKGSVAATAPVAAPSQSDHVEPAGTSNDASSDEVEELKKQIATFKRVQTATLGQLSKLREEKEYLENKEKKRGQTKRKTRASNGGNDVEMGDGDENES
jgi:pre-rRNA-processing protein IPI3